MKYPARFKPVEGGAFVVSFRDIPEAFTQGDDKTEAFRMAEDALLTAMEFYFEDKRLVKLPSKLQEGERYVSLPLNASAKILLLNEILVKRVRPADLARLMGIFPQEVPRLLNLKHITKIDTLADAFKALGKELDLVIR